MKQYDDNLEFKWFQIGDCLNNSKVLVDVFKFVMGIHTKICTVST